MAQIYLNNWQTKTTAAIDSSTPYIPVPAAAVDSLKAAGLPDLDVSDGLTYLNLTLANASTGTYEVVQCVGYKGQTLGCLRGNENDAPAKEWPAGTLMYMSLTAGNLAEMQLILTNHSTKIADLSNGSAGGGGSTGGGTKYSGSGPTLYSNGSGDASLNLLPLVNMRCLYNWYPTYPSDGRALLVAPQDDNLYGGSLDIDFRLVIADDISTLAVQSERFECWWNVPCRPEVADSGPQYVVDVQPGEYMLSLRKWPLTKATAVLTPIYSPSFPPQ